MVWILRPGYGVEVYYSTVSGEVGDGISGNERRSRKVIPNGGFMETDVHASQQYAGLLSLELGSEVREKTIQIDAVEKAN